MEVLDAYQHEIRKARKTHLCCECYGKIQPGELYHLHKGVLDGEWEQYKICSDCQELREEIEKKSNFGADDGLAFGYLAEEIEESRDVGLCRKFAHIKLKRKNNAEYLIWNGRAEIMQLHQENEELRKEIKELKRNI